MGAVQRLEESEAGPLHWDCAWVSYRALLWGCLFQGLQAGREANCTPPSRHHGCDELLTSPISFCLMCPLPAPLTPLLLCFYVPAFPRALHRRLPLGFASCPYSEEWQASWPAFQRWKDYLLHLGRTPQAESLSSALEMLKKGGCGDT